MAHGDVHLVGSIPLQDTTAVFSEVSAVLGDRIKRIPDGETGPRLRWILALEPVFAYHPAFEKTEEPYVTAVIDRSECFRYRLRDGIDPETVEFSQHPNVEAALTSYAVFSRLKKEGRIRPDLKFQVGLATAFSTVRAFVIEKHQHVVEPQYTEGLKRAVEDICDRIPHRELAIQWDIASAVFERLERGETGRFGSTRDAILKFFAQNIVELGEAVPPNVDLIFHLCYGDNNHKHSIEPASTAILVDFANYVDAHITRSVQLYHLPVPRDRSDEEYFAPLAQLRLKSPAEVALGLIHMTDGFNGTMNRVRVAQKYLRSFLVGTECGFGRRPATQVPTLLKLHAQVAAKVAGG